jgi:hypothetical protein
MVILLDMSLEHIATFFFISLPPRNILSYVLYIRLLIAIWRERARLQYMCLRPEYLNIIKCIIRRQSKVILDRYFSIILFMLLYR